MKKLFFVAGLLLRIALHPVLAQNGIPDPANLRATPSAKSTRAAIRKSSVNADSLPPTFPSIGVNAPNPPSDVEIYLSNFSLVSSEPYIPYLMVLSTTGAPTFYREMPQECLDFKWQPNGTMTYYDQSLREFLVMDSSFAVVDTVHCMNGYTTDPHDLELLPDGHALLLSYDPETVNMSALVKGGQPDALVTGLVIQELDEHRNVVFQWRSWDHFSILDAEAITLTASSIDYVHGNAIQRDTDGNILLSSRHLCELTKINRATGEIMWRLGGLNNQFTFLNDSLHFNYQHAVRRIANGNITMFDNGDLRVPQFSRAVEYKVDEEAKTATLVWQYRHRPDIYGYAMGYVQRLDDGRTLIGWGTGNPSVTLLDQNDSLLSEFSLPQGQSSYRAFAFPARGVVTSTGTHHVPLPAALELRQNYPNPFNPTTTIAFRVAESGPVTLKVFDILGREVTTLVDGVKAPGDYAEKFDAAGYSSGVYFARLESGAQTQIRRMLLVR